MPADFNYDKIPFFEAIPFDGHFWTYWSFGIIANIIIVTQWIFLVIFVIDDSNCNITAHSYGFYLDTKTKFFIEQYFLEEGEITTTEVPSFFDKIAPIEMKGRGKNLLAASFEKKLLFLPFRPFLQLLFGQFNLYFSFFFLFDNIGIQMSHFVLEICKFL